jgi:hypothetical protein
VTPENLDVGDLPSILTYDVGYFQQQILVLPFSFYAGNLFTKRVSAAGVVSYVMTPVRSAYLRFRVLAEAASHKAPGISYSQLAFAPNPAGSDGYAYGVLDCLGCRSDPVSSSY